MMAGPCILSPVNIGNSRAASMSRSGRSITVAGIFAATLALRVAAAQEPPPPVVQETYSGSELFKTYCVACHGTSARGDGPLAANMKKPPPDLTQFAARNGGEFPSELVGRIIDGRQPVKGHGGPDMPVWGDAFRASRTGNSEEAVQARIKALVEYLKFLQERRAQ
jgi:mono/diheme cytochrome c family protein